MSSRLHNKYHRHNHHTWGSTDPRYPDSAHDPIASFEYPFNGPFVSVGPVSAAGYQGSTQVNFQTYDLTFVDYPAGTFTGSSTNYTTPAILATTPAATGVAFNAVGDSYFSGNTFFGTAPSVNFQTPSDGVLVNGQLINAAYVDTNGNIIAQSFNNIQTAQLSAQITNSTTQYNAIVTDDGGNTTIVQSASGEFLQILVNGVPRAIRLWSYQ